MKTFRIAPARLRSRHRGATHLFSGAALATLAASAYAQSAPAPADEINIVLTPEIVENALQSLRLETRLTGDADGETKLILPESDANAAQWKSWFEIEVENATISGEGVERVLRHAPSAPITLRYKITQKSAVNYSNIVQPTYFSVLGAGVFVQLEGREPAYRFKWGPVPAGWKVVSDLDHAVGDPSTPYPVSTLYGGSDIVVTEHKVGKGRLRLAMRNDSALKPEFLGALLGRIGHAANDLWQDSGSDYLVTLTTLPDYKAQAGTGLGDAFALYLSPDPDMLELRNTLAHEYLHTWIGRRFGGGPRWFSEGFTQYYSPILNLRAGSYSLTDFATHWNAMLRSYATSPLRLKPAAEVEPVSRGSQDARQITENRSAMVAALIDYQLSRQTKGKMRLADVMVEVKKDWDAKRGKGNGPERIVERVRAMARLDVQPIIDKHLVRGEALVLPTDAFGNCLTLATLTVPGYDRGFDVEGLGKPVTKVDPSSRAYAAGIREGMTIVAREGGKAGDSSVENAYRVKDGSGERVIRYLPVGKEMMQVQQVQVRPGLKGKAAARCARAVSGLRT
jgi:predicted metalloprotease with PDZ domain